MKKAQIQIQFNWVFVIIIGSVLLIFFFTLISGQSRSTEQRIDISQSRYFETIISATGQKSGTLKEYRLKDIAVEFECNANAQVYTYSVENLPSRDTTYDILFTQEILVSDELQTWTQDWQVPFSAGNFLYLTNSKHAFVFYESQSNDFKALYEAFPKNISFEVIDNPNVDVLDDWKTYKEISFEELYERNYERHTYVFLVGEEPRRTSLETSTFFAQEANKVLVYEKGESVQDLFEQGKIYYFTPSQYNQFSLNLPSDPQELSERYENIPENRVSSYLKKGSLFGAMFSEDKEFYECNMQKAFKRLELITQLYAFRTEQLLLDDAISNLCKEALGINEYDESNPYFPKERLDLLTSQSAQAFSSDAVLDIHKSLIRLEENNKFILGIPNCPSLY